MISFHRHLKVFLAVAASIWFFPTASGAVTTFYTTQAAFNAAVPVSGLLEDLSSVGPAQLNVPLPFITLPSGTYTGLQGAPFANVFVADPPFTNFGAAANPTTERILTASGNEDITVTLVTQFHAVGFHAYFNGQGPLTLIVLGVGGSVLGALPILPLGLDPATGLADEGYLGFTSDDPIYGFRWIATGGDQVNTGFTAISVSDSFIANPTTPLPGALPLFASGLGALGLLGWRRKRKAA